MSKRDIIVNSARVSGWLRRIAEVATVTAAFGLALVIPGGSAEGQVRPAQVLNTDSPQAIPGRYIVVFRESEGVAGPEAVAVRRGEPRDRLAAERSRAAQALVRQLGGRVELAYEAALTGFSAELPPQALEALRTAPGVAWIEADQVTRGDTIQNNPPRGLDRTSERPLPLDNRFTYSGTGAGVTAYVIDSGIRASHNEFGGRASAVFTAIMDGNGTNDCHGHGTHVAGTIGGATFGVAKQVNIVAVRVLDCNGSGTVSGAIAGVNWVTANAVFPAVANMSLEASASPALDTAVTNSIATGIPYAIAAGNSNLDACNFSPARTPNAITVGSINPLNDTRAVDSNFGTCLDLFGPGVGILSAWFNADNATNTISGTSMAAPHVTGVAALILQINAAATPAQVLAAIHNAANVASTPGWGGIVNPSAGSPNELLHWGSAGNDGFNDGDPHLITVDGLHYDFQGAGEFVYLREPDGLEIQIRETAVTTAGVLGPQPHHGLSTCVSVNSAVAARVGEHRVTFQPNIDGKPDPTGLQLRIDGELTSFPAGGSIQLGSAGAVHRSGAQGMEIQWADGTRFVATPAWWAGPNVWYMNADIFGTRASSGLMGWRAAGSWLPAMPGGASLGAMPESLADRYAVLYGTFGEAWRVTDDTSLFDYRQGTSTASFTHRDWPKMTAPCTLPSTPSTPPRPANPELAQRVCRAVADQRLNANCVADVTATGEGGFAKLYLQTERLRKTDGGPAVTVRFSLHAGRVVPHGALNGVATEGSTLNFDFVYPFRPNWAWDVRLGRSRFAGRPGEPDVDLATLSANARFTFNPTAPVRFFLNGGLGLYHFDPGDFEGGGNLGLGLNAPVGPRFDFEATYNYHAAFTASPSSRFSQVQLGLLVSF